MAVQAKTRLCHKYCCAVVAGSLQIRMVYRRMGHHQVQTGFRKDASTLHLQMMRGLHHKQAHWHINMVRDTASVTSQLVSHTIHARLDVLE